MALNSDLMTVLVRIGGLWLAVAAIVLFAVAADGQTLSGPNVWAPIKPEVSVIVYPDGSAQHIIEMPGGHTVVAPRVGGSYETPPVHTPPVYHPPTTTIIVTPEASNRQLK